jgi:hypothetical protein
MLVFVIVYRNQERGRKGGRANVAILGAGYFYSSPDIINKAIKSWG